MDPAKRALESAARTSKGLVGWGLERANTVWPQGTKGGSALIIFTPFTDEIS